MNISMFWTVVAALLFVLALPWLLAFAAWLLKEAGRESREGLGAFMANPWVHIKGALVSLVWVAVVFAALLWWLMR